MPLLSSPAAAPKTPEEASRAVEAMVIKQLLTSSGAFHKTSEPGSGVTASLFIDTLADAIAKSSPLGLSNQLHRELSVARPAPMAPSPSSSPSLSALTAAPNHITSGFGARADPFDGHRANHQGIDLAAPEGTPILSAAAGVVRSAGPRGGYGETIEVEHSPGVTTLYAHAGATLVQPGQQVAAGQALGLVGQTGRATGPHLHFEVRVKNHPVDPQQALKAYRFCADKTGVPVNPPASLP
jgi:murein DD-endopeptidase MepM/ murein hydrolase activator NlpD